MTVATLCIIACHGGPADHFATYYETLTLQGMKVEVFAASGPALKKFQDRGVPATSFSVENLTEENQNILAASIAKTCSQATTVITDVGHLFDVKIQRALADYAKDTQRLAYYDNPEPYVPGGYSTIAASVMKLADGILFANKNLAHEKIYESPNQEVDLEGKSRIGIGFYPIALAEKLHKRRSIEHGKMREDFLRKWKIPDCGQKILVYFGGNNSEYFTKAFPTFLNLLLAAKDHVVILQQHPNAKLTNTDVDQLQDLLKKSPVKLPEVIISDFSSDDAQVLADAALYYQTSMGPQFILEGIPTIQVAHKKYNDILVRSNLAPSVSTIDQFEKALEDLDKHQSISKEELLQRLGIDYNWQKRLKSLFSGA